MNLNQPPLEEPSECTTHYSAMESIHLMGPYENSKSHVEGKRGVLEDVSEWLAQLVTKASNP